MTRVKDYDDPHFGELILSECPRCRLPIYESDPHRRIGIPPGALLVAYHSGCAIGAEGIYWEEQLSAIAQRLRGLGYVLELKVIRPVR